MTGMHRMGRMIPLLDDSYSPSDSPSDSPGDVDLLLVKGQFRWFSSDSCYSKNHLSLPSFIEPADDNRSKHSYPVSKQKTI